MIWQRSDLTAAGLGRGLIHGTRPNHAALSLFGSQLIVTDSTGTVVGADLPAWCALVGREVPTEADLRWLTLGDTP